MRIVRGTLIVVVAIVLVGLAGLVTTGMVYGGGRGDRCASCHEIRPAVDAWRVSTHREVACNACHGSSIVAGLRMQVANAGRVRRHLRGEAPEQIRIRERDVPALVARCAHCHAQESADWRSGPHAVTYAEIFLDETHNRERPLVDDCLRCHGMHFDGGIERLVSPVDSQGPWTLRDPELAREPTIPCMTCHAIHRRGDPLGARSERASIDGPQQPVLAASIALLDRRSLEHVPADRLTLPAMREGERRVETSPDRRQALCYQCHAPLATAEVFSGDDRTPTGVHEGLSCAACHAKHGQQTRASCAACHPRLSNCGLDVEAMDTSFRDPNSPHDVHRVTCLDCHPVGVPEARVEAASRRMR